MFLSSSFIGCADNRESENTTCKRSFPFFAPMSFSSEGPLHVNGLDSEDGFLYGVSSLITCSSALQRWAIPRPLFLTTILRYFYVHNRVPVCGIISASSGLNS